MKGEVVNYRDRLRVFKPLGLVTEVFKPLGLGAKFDYLNWFVQFFMKTELWC